jgi:hypothetical protein
MMRTIDAPRLVLADSEYLLRFPGGRGQMESTSFPGGAASLMPGEVPVGEASLERAIEAAEDWLMPHASYLQDKALEVHDPSGRFASQLESVLAVTTSQWTIEDIEVMFLRVVDMATGRGSAALQAHRKFVADLLVIRELAHHGRVSAVRLE